MIFPADANLILSDNTTGDVSETKHGLFPKLPSVADNKTYGLKNGAVSEVVSGGGATVSNTAPATPTEGQLWLDTGSTPVDQYAIIAFTIDGGGAVPSTGAKTEVWCWVAGTIVEVRLIADVAGSIVLDIKKAAFGTTPTSSIVASAPPTLSGAKYGSDAVLTGWTTAIALNDVLAFSVTSASTLTKCTLQLKVKV